MIGGGFIRVGGQQRFDDLFDHLFRNDHLDAPLLHPFHHIFTPDERVASCQGLELSFASDLEAALVIVAHGSGTFCKKGVLHFFEMSTRNKENKGIHEHIIRKSIHLVMEEPLFYTSDMIKLIVFLGNPGKTHELTRHNVGWMVAKEAYGPIAWSEKFSAKIAKDGPVHLLKPLTYMNESGRSVGLASSYFGIRSDEVLVVSDDLELDFGTIRLQQGGGLKGHNGLKSIQSSLGSGDFWRLRIGIGRPIHGSVSSFVLSRFTPEEEISLPLVLQEATKLLGRSIPAQRVLL